MGFGSKFLMSVLITILYGACRSEVIKIASFVPPGSPWSQVMDIWAQAVAKKSNGSLQLQCFYSSSQGSEADMVQKMRIGQLDGALLTVVGLSRIYLPVLALQLPGLFKNWTKLSAARQTLDSEFQQGMNRAGFSFLGWSDFGAVRLLSQRFIVKVPNDIRGKKPFRDINNPIEQALYQSIGNCTPVSVNLVEVLPQLNMGAINLMFATSILARQLRWSSKFDRISADVNSLVTGGLVIASPRFNALSAEHRAILQDTGKIATSALTKRIQDEDNSAFSYLKSSMLLVTFSATEQSQWNAIYTGARQILGQSVLPSDSVTRMEQLAN